MPDGPDHEPIMRKRGIAKLDDVQIDYWAVGQVDPKYHGRRLLRAVSYFKGASTNFYGQPIEGVGLLVDMGIHRDRRLLHFSGETFPRWFGRRTKTAPADPPLRKVALFSSCLVNFQATDVGKATVQVLEKNGVHADHRR